MTLKGFKFYYRLVTDPASEWIRATDGVMENPDYVYTNLLSGTEYELAAMAVDMAGNESEIGTPLVVSTPVHNPADDPLSASDQSAIDTIMLNNKGSAFGAWVSTIGPKGQYQKAYGKNYTGGATPTAGADLTVDDKFRYGSNTKMYTAVLIWREIEAGHLTLDTTLDNFLPTLKNAEKITIHHLLQQRTGLPEAFGYGSAIGQQNGINFFLHPTGACDVIALVKGACTYSNFEPGTSYEYANTNYIILGEILQQLDVEYGTSRPIHVILRDFLAEIGLAETEWPTPNTAVTADYYMTPPFSRGYMDNPAWATMVATVNSLPLAFLLGWLYWSLVPALSGGWPAQPYMEMTAGNTAFGGAAGCLGGTVEDLQKFALFLADGAGLSEETQLMRAEEFCTYARYTPSLGYDGNGWMGAGLGMMSYGDWRGWIGAWLGYNSCCWHNVKNGAVIITAVNWYTGPSWDLFMRVAHHLYPDSLARPDWTLRQRVAGPDSSSATGGGMIFQYHAPGDENGLLELPHTVPFYP